MPALFKAGLKSISKVIFMSSNNPLFSFEGELALTKLKKKKKRNQYHLNTGKFYRRRRQNDIIECTWGLCGRPLWGHDYEA